MKKTVPNTLGIAWQLTTQSFLSFFKVAVHLLLIHRRQSIYFTTLNGAIDKFHSKIFIQVRFYRFHEKHFMNWASGFKPTTLQLLSSCLSHNFHMGICIADTIDHFAPSGSHYSGELSIKPLIWLPPTFPGAYALHGVVVQLLYV